MATEDQTPPPPDGGNPDSDDSTIRLLIDGMENPSDRALFQKMHETNTKMQAQVQKIADDAEKLEVDKYNLKRDKMLEDIKVLNPKIAEKYKDAHYNQLEIAFDTLSSQSGLQSFDKGASAKKAEKEQYPIAYDSINKKYIYSTN